VTHVRVLLIAAAALASQAPASAAPEFTLTTLAGDSVALSSMKGRPVFLNFWATWCTPCRGEMADIITAYRAHTDQRLAVFAINLTDQEHMADVGEFVAELQMPFPVLLDRIDTLGFVRFVNQGPIAPEAIQRGLNLILPKGEP
jgi:thiol-disulfide isomerase/thioredoxin